MQADELLLSCRSSYHPSWQGPRYHTFVGQAPSSQWDTASPIEINARKWRRKGKGDGGREEVRKE